MNIDKSQIQDEIDSLILLYKNKSFNKGLEISENLIKKYPESPDIYFLNGMINLALNNYIESIDSFSNTIIRKNDYFDAYNNKGIALYNIGNHAEALVELKKGLKLKPNDYTCLNNIGNCLNSMKEFEKAIWYYNESIKYNPNYVLPVLNIIKILTFYDTKNNLNNLISTNNKLRLLSFDLKIDKFISDGEIVSFFKKCLKIIPDEIDRIELKNSEIFRRDKSLNCGRHFEVFNKFNIIPEFCFGCYKVQIEPNNLLDLIKLYIVFDKIKLSKNNIRKCSIETRPAVGGTYKGFIYCSSIQEAETICNNLSTTLQKTTNKKIPVKIKRGCSEFAISFPNYAVVDSNSNKFINYNNDWKSKENIIDNNKNLIKKKFHTTIDGVTLNDILIIKNWIVYAKKIEDFSYKKISKDVVDSKYISNQVENQLEKRKNEFIKSINI